MKNLIGLILGKLLFTANRGSYSKDFRNNFYIVKYRILVRFGKHDGYDLQVIPPASCTICDNGIYKGRYMNWDEEHWDTCGRCKGLVQIPERKIALERLKLGDYIFHQPAREVDVTLITPVGRIDGYVNRPNYSKYKFDCALILMLLFHRQMFLNYWKTEGHFSQRNTPITYLYNLGSIRRYYWWRITERLSVSLRLGANDDLPF
jgi:hypothetical protein